MMLFMVLKCSDGRLLGKKVPNDKEFGLLKRFLRDDECLELYSSSSLDKISEDWYKREEIEVVEDFLDIINHK